MKPMAVVWRRRAAIACLVAGLCSFREVRAQTTVTNVIVLLDSSGSMRDTPDARDTGNDRLSLVDSPDEGELVADDPGSKLAQAKRVLAQIVGASPPGLRFHLGKYRQSVVPADVGPDVRNRFLYATTDPRGADILVNPAADGAAAPGLKRSARDWRRIEGVKTYYLIAGKFWNGETIEVREDGGQARVASRGVSANAPFVDIQRRSRTGQPMGAPVRFRFQGIRWHKANRTENPANRLAVLANNASCGGFAPLTSDATEIGRYLGPEVQVSANGSIDGYVEGTLGAPPAAAPREHGIRASGLTPLANALADIGSRFASSWSGLAAEKTFVLLLTDGDDTCVDRKTGDVTVSTADTRALRAAQRAQLIVQASKVPVMVVTFGIEVSARRSQWIAWGGTGLVRPTTGTGEAVRWASPPTDAERKACSSCRDALTARDATELEAAVRKAIDLGLHWERN
jgi:hypothetical protein